MGEGPQGKYPRGCLSTLRPLAQLPSPLTTPRYPTLPPASLLTAQLPPPPQVPDLHLSQEVLEYGSVQTGKAGVVTLQLHNHRQVRACWGDQNGVPGCLIPVLAGQGTAS